jgi:hypothetical protein
MSPGCSLFDLPSFDASTIDLQLSDPANSLTLDVTSISLAPEPRSLVLVAAGAAGLLVLRRRGYRVASGRAL